MKTSIALIKLFLGFFVMGIMVTFGVPMFPMFVAVIMIAALIVMPDMFNA